MAGEEFWRGEDNGFVQLAPKITFEKWEKSMVQFVRLAYYFEPIPGQKCDKFTFA